MTDLEDAPTSDASVDKGALVRRLTDLARSGNQGGREWDEVQAALAQLRLASMTPLEPPAPSLRAQILAMLAGGEKLKPTQISKTLGKSTTVVSRVLTNLQHAGIVDFTSDPDDKRARLYALVDPLEVGDVAPPPKPDEAEAQLIALGIAAAVRARRREHQLEYSNDRLVRLLNQAETAGAHDLALLARRELITSLRQANRMDQVGDHVAVLESMVSGQQSSPAYLFTAASGSLNYEYGRDETRDLAERMRHLIAAEVAFGRCGRLRNAQDWAPREGWALFSRAELWRKQTEFGKAQSLATRAAEVFARYDDIYGSAEVARVRGFCHRLSGEFEEAIAILTRAQSLATQAASDRCRADVLLQLGDAHRCIGDLASARMFLGESQKIAERLSRTDTLGFTLSALAAVEFENGELDAARGLALKAQRHLGWTSVGRAMNNRRLAVISRELAHGGDKSEIETCRNMFNRSLAEFQELNSPAGVAACLVGIGKLHNADHDAAIANLKGLASSPAGRVLLPKDPWMPGLVTQWAEESASAEVRQVVDWTFRDEAGTGIVTEMAAEPRRLATLEAA